MDISMNAVMILVVTACLTLGHIDVLGSEWQAPSPSIAWSPFALPLIPAVPSSPPSLPPISGWDYPQVPAVAPYTPTQYVVGDESGWSLGVDYAAWAQGKTFRVGDSLVFKYAQGSHNVYKVGGPDFRACSVPSQGEVLTSGNDVITLATAGMKWYICGVSNGGHCMAGQRLMITVVPAAAGYDDQSPATSPSPSTSSPYFSSSHSVDHWSPSMSPTPSPTMPPVAAAPAAVSYTFFNRFLKK